MTEPQDNQGVTPPHLNTQGITPSYSDQLSEVIREILLNHGNTVAELHKRFNSTDKRDKLDWETFDSYCRYEDNQATQSILQALTSVKREMVELACDKCRVRMEDKLNNGGTQHE